MTAGFQRQEPGGRNRCCTVLTVGKRNKRIVAGMNDEGGRRDLIERTLSWDMARLVEQDTGETAAHRVHQFQRAEDSAGIFFAKGTLNIFGDADQRQEFVWRDIFNRPVKKVRTDDAVDPRLEATTIFIIQRFGVTDGRDHDHGVGSLWVTQSKTVG